MKIKIIVYFVYQCLKNGVNPWMFFQIHSNFFNEKKGIYSKLDLQNSIPNFWILKCHKITIKDSPQSIEKKFGFPLVGKPEWGQNSHGVKYINSQEVLKNFVHNAHDSEISYLIQEHCPLKKEFELTFTTQIDRKVKIWSLVESINTDSTHINSIHGRTQYTEFISSLSQKDQLQIQAHIEKLDDFRFGRIGIKTDSLEDLIAGKFKIFEINVFIPLPLVLLAGNIEKKEKNTFMKDYISELVILTKGREKRKYKEVFFRKIFLHYKIKLSQNTVSKKMKRKLYAWIENTFMNGCSDYNPISVRRASRSKKQARDMFKKNNIPHADGCVFFNPYTAYRFVKQYGFPIVLKPNVGGYSRGSYFPIETYKDFWKAMFFVKLWWPSSVVETYLLGKNYRVVVTKKSLDIAMERYPSFIIGDGEKTISQLIDAENTTRKEMNLAPIISPIQKSNKIKRFIKKQGYTFDSLLEKGKKISLYHRVSLAPGGILETVDTQTITQKNREVFLKILDEFGANIFGIDVIMEKGIETDYDEQKTIFLELNSRPYLKMHTVPRYGKAPDMKPLYKKLDALEINGKGLY